MVAAVLLSLATLATVPARGQEDVTPEDTVDAFHRTLAEGGREAALSHLAPGVVIFEGGGAEMSRDEYARHHLESDMKFSAAVQTEITARETRTEGATAWVMTRSRTRGTFDGRDIDLTGTETMVLLRSDDGWKIVHVHWSSRSDH